jgi:hypothetical protein
MLGGQTEGMNPVSGRGYAYADFANAIQSTFNLGYERTIIHKDMARMAQDDEVVKFALDAVASRATGYPDPTVNVMTVVLHEKDKDDVERTPAEKQAQTIIDDLMERIDLRGKTWQIIREGVHYGNDVNEIVPRVENGRWVQIDGLKRLPEHTIWPLKDKRGGRIPGYIQRLENSPDMGGDVIFAEYEILHFMFGCEENYLGTPLFSAARKSWKRLNMAEDATAIARLYRAFMKFLHKVPVRAEDPIQKQQESIDAYKKAINERQIWNSTDGAKVIEQDPITVKTDFYIPDDGSGRGGVEMFDPENAQLQNVNDILHFLRRLVTASTVPWRYFPFEGSTPKLSEGGGTAEDVTFACTLLMTHMMVQKGFNKLFGIELVLHGIDPGKFRIEYQMAPLNTIDLLRAAQRDKARSATLSDLAQLMPGIVEHPDVILREFTSLSDISVKSLLADGKLSEGVKEALIRKMTPTSAAGGDEETDNRVTVPGGGTPEAKEKL